MNLVEWKGIRRVTSKFRFDFYFGICYYVYRKEKGVYKMGKDNFTKAAEFCYNNMGVAYEPEEEYFICPECGEVIYKGDYDLSIEGMMDCCPICGFQWYEEE